MAEPDEEEFTELVSAQFGRVDLVGSPANGSPGFLIMKDDGTGLLEPEFVAALIAKAQPDSSGREQVTMPNGITLTGSAAEVAAFIHKAAQSDRERAEDASEYERVCKEKYSAADRRKMAASGAAMSNESYPIADEEDLHKAIHAVGRGGASHNAIRKHIISRARSLGKSSLIPDNWNSDGSLKGDSVSKTQAVAKADMGPELDDGVDGLDPTVPLAAPGDGLDDAPGDPADPGSPAWEAIDAATAQKWTSIAVRLKNALCVLADREMLEAAGADPSDAENAFDLQDAMCAVDYVIDVLAGFAVDEQAEAELGGEAMAAAVKSAAPGAEVQAAIAKSMSTGGLPEALAAVETYAAVVRKSGRVLSAVNEAHIREAHHRLASVLSSLPQAPTADDGQPVAKTASEEPSMPEPTLSSDVTSAAGQEPAMGTQEAAPVAKAADAPEEAADGAETTPVAKADGDAKKAMCVVYNQAGKLIGIVDPDDITPVSNSEAEPDDAPDDGDAQDPPPAADDMTPAPPAAAGTPADAVPDDGTVAKSLNGNQEPDARAVLKSIVTEALAELLAAQGPAEDVAKSADVAGLTQRLEELAGRLETVEKQDAKPGVFANGAVPPPGSAQPARPSLRGQDQGTQPVDVAKAAELKARISSGTLSAAEQTAAFNELNELAVAKITEIRSGAQR